MMMKITRFLRVAAVALVATAAIPLQSQAQTSGTDETQTEQTQTTTTLRWNGSDPAYLLDEDQTFYLYNVGTGKFLKADGEWGIQGCLMFQTFGTGVFLEKAVTPSKGTRSYDKEGNVVYNVTSTTTKSAYVINTDVVTSSASSLAKYLGVNYANYSNKSGWNNSDATYGVIFDAQSYSVSEKDGFYDRSLVFEKVDGTQNAYYIKESIGTITATYNYWSGTATFSSSDGVTCYWGAKVGKDATNTWTTDNGDIATFMTAEKDGDSDTYKDSVDQVVKGDYKDYYTWILVSEKELQEAHVKEVNENVGLVANMSYLFHDQYFDRNRSSFEGAWTVVDNSETSSDYRWDWRNASITEDVWSKAVFRKITCDSKPNGKYSFASFEGIGGAYTSTFVAPATGYYDFEIRGFSQGNQAYFFAATSMADKVEIALPSPSTKFTKTNTEAALSAPGKELYENEEGKYTVKVQLYAEEGQTVYVGVYKKGATQSTADYEDEDAGTSYFHDTDYVGVDNLQAYYVGETTPFVLDEDAPSAEYLLQDFGEKTPVVYLKRTFSRNKWNTLVLPIDLTAAQVKEAFGEDTKLAGLKGVGTVDGYTNSIDFETISLEQDKTVLNKGKMYLIKPVNDGAEMSIKGYDDIIKLYTIGRRKIALTASDTITTETQGEGSSKQQVKFTGTYITLKAIEGPQAGSYVFSGGDMYHLKSAMSIKGFRGWFENIDPKVQSIKFNIGSGEITGIDEVTTGDSKAKANGAVFTIDGVKVRDNAISLDGLPAGIYIYNGKKHLVK